MPPTYQITPAPGGVSRGFTHVPHLRAIHATLRTRASLLLPLTCAGPRHAGACCFGGPLACWAWPCAPADVAHGHGPAEKKRRQPVPFAPARPRTWRRRAGGRGGAVGTMSGERGVATLQGFSTPPALGACFLPGGGQLMGSQPFSSQSGCCCAGTRMPGEECGCPDHRHQAMHQLICDQSAVNEEEKVTFDLTTASDDDHDYAQEAEGGSSVSKCNEAGIWWMQIELITGLRRPRVKTRGLRRTSSGESEAHPSESSRQGKHATEANLLARAYPRCEAVHLP